MITAKTNPAPFIERFFIESLLKTPAYHIDAPDVDYKLDQNEIASDWPMELKERVTQRLLNTPWNRYPKAQSKDLTKKLGDFLGINPECLLTGPGSDLLITFCLTHLTKQMTGKLIIARPSFPIYEAHCRYMGLPYTPWLQDENLDYDPSTLPELTDGSIVIFASPNNPTGSVLPYDQLETWLSQNPNSLFLADEAYYEFSDKPYTPLIEKYSNLVLIRTFSKALGAAGVRVGYIVAGKPFIDAMTRVRGPFLLNIFATIAAEELLTDSNSHTKINQAVASTIKERDRVFSELSQLGQSRSMHVKNSHANFLVLKWPGNTQCQNAYDHLVSHRILVRNISKGPGLEGCLRATIGSPKENNALIESVRALNTSV